MSALLDQKEIPDCNGGHEPQNTEFDYWADNIEGQLPSNLSGTFFRNGPGRLKIGEHKFSHWFDGDGMLCAFTFKGGQLHFKNRYVRTPKYLKETASGKIEYRGFGTQKPGGMIANILRPPTNPANTNSIYHGGKLLALNEGGKPYELEPGNLSTMGEFNYAGKLSATDVFSAHGKVEPRSGDLINFGVGVDISLSGFNAKISIYRINPSGKLVKRGIIKLESFPFCHDYAITGKYAIFFINSIVTDGMMDVLLGRASIADRIAYDESQAMQVIVIDLDTLEEVRRFETNHGAIIHFGNAWQVGDEIFVDGMYADNFDANEGLRDVTRIERFAGGEYRRYRLNMKTGGLSWDVMTKTESEFPTFNPLVSGQQNQYTFTACAIDNGHGSFYNGFQCIGLDGQQTLVTLPPGHYGSEPLFALADDSDDEKDGYVLELIYNAFENRSELSIVTACDITHEVCRVILPHHIPHQFHGFFTRQTFL